MNCSRLAWLGVLVLALMAELVVAQPPDQSARGPGQGPGGPGRDFRPPMSPVVAALDSNHDGELSAKEIAKAAGALKALDRNGDGKLGSEELRPQFGGPGGPDNPGGPGMGRSSRNRPGPGRSGSRGARTSKFDSKPLPKDDAEKKILDVLDDLNQQQRGGMMNVPTEDGRLLRLLAETTGAKRVVEIGTSNGYSGIWLCLALRTTGGKLTTMEIDSQRAAMARENFQRAGVSDLVTLIEGDAHQEIAKLKGPIDLLFIDADKEGYLDYLNKLLPLVRPGGLIVAHNMNPGQADAEYVKAITTNKDVETSFLHMQGAGVGVTLKKR